MSSSFSLSGNLKVELKTKCYLFVAAPVAAAVAFRLVA